MSQVIIKLEREEALACYLGLRKEKYRGKPYKWAQQALKKVEKAMGWEAN